MVACFLVVCAWGGCGFVLYWAKMSTTHLLDQPLLAMRPTFLVLLVFLTALLLSSASATANDWSEVTTPSHGSAEVFGSPAAGCIGGAVILPPEGPGYQVMRLLRHRNYGHPSLVHFVQTLAENLQAKHPGVMLVGDLGQPRGGPTASLHRSHQNGLDVDIWYWLYDRVPNDDEVEHLSAHSVLHADRRSVDPTHWTSAQVDLLRLIVDTEEVERLFVHPVIKKRLCGQEPDRSWLSKVRPWWGHDDHLHVRLRCPLGNDACVSQKPIPPGDGCGTELDEWLAMLAKPKQAEPYPKQPRPPVLPPECNAVLHAD